MPLTSVKLRPGIDRSNTNYSSEGGYYACDKVRFRYGFPQKIGGWVKYLTTQFVGTARSLFVWTTLNNTNLVAIGTNVKYYVESSGGLYDVTPVRSTVTLANNPFATVNGSATLTVTHTGHGAIPGDYVTFSGATTFAGISTATINIEFQILTVPTANSYTITVGQTANATTTGGGAAVQAAYQVSNGGSFSVAGRGWNAGTWGRSGWNTGSNASTFAYSSLRLWTQDAFGEDLVFNIRNGQIYYWDFTGGLTARAVELKNVAGSSNAPLVATKMLLSNSDRHLIALGCNVLGATTQDHMLVRWADTESITQWTPTSLNTAGSYRLTNGNYIVTAIKAKQEILIFTDSSVYSMQSIGIPYTFGFVPMADNISIMSPNAVVTVGNATFWMGTDKFYSYSGRAATLFCTLSDYIFSDINKKQADQIFAGTNEGFSEVWWFYCSANSAQIDRYVIYNYDEQTWSYGTMARTAWIDSALKDTPLATANGYVYRHELGLDDDRTAPINAWVESSDFDIGEGDDFSFVKRMLPDIQFIGSEAVTPSVDITLTARSAPGATYRTEPTNTVTRTTSVPYDLYAERVDLRLRGRQLKLRIESSGIGVQWRLGVPRIEIQPDGKKI